MANSHEIRKIYDEPREAPIRFGVARVSGEPLNKLQQFLIDVLPGREISRMSEVVEKSPDGVRSGAVTVTLSNRLITWQQVIPAYAYPHHTVPQPYEDEPAAPEFGPRTTWY